MTSSTLRVERTPGVLIMSDDEIRAECKKQVATFHVDMHALERVKGAFTVTHRPRRAAAPGAETVHEAERDLVHTVLHILPKLTPNNLSAILLEAERLEALADA